MNKIVKVIGGVYPPTREFTGSELVKLKEEYLEDFQKDFDIVNEHLVAGAGEEFVRLIFDKITPPFQYWLENKIKCEIINKKNENKGQ